MSNNSSALSWKLDFDWYSGNQDRVKPDPTKVIPKIKCEVKEKKNIAVNPFQGIAYTLKQKK